MRVIIIGCGRVGARVAAELDQRGETVTVIDTSARAFSRLPETFGGETVRGNGTDEDMMRTRRRRAGRPRHGADRGRQPQCPGRAARPSTRFGVPRVIAKINDPLRGEAYRALGLETICRTIILGDALVTAAVEGAEATNGFVEPPTAQPLRGAPPPGRPRPTKPCASGPTPRRSEPAEPSIVQPGDGREGGF